jgi:PIN domain nuclease of toxin-antitoxin system
VNLLLDSCALIWLASEPARLSQTATAAINNPASTLYVSHATLWEITLKHHAGKLVLPDAPRRWWAEQVEKWGLVELPMTADVLLRGSELPPHHKDPFDRVILAQALLHDLSLVSSDRAFPAYSVRVVW